MQSAQKPCFDLYSSSLESLLSLAGQVTPEENRVLQVHAMNLSGGLDTNGLQEDDIKET